MSRFSFNILTEPNSLSRYQAIPTKDPYTFYLLECGKGYLGTKLLFGEDTKGFTIVNTSGDKTSAIKNGELYIVTVPGVLVNTVELPQGIYEGVKNDNNVSVKNVTYSTIASYITQNAVKSMTVDDGNGNQTITGFTGNNTDIATTKAIVDYVQSAISGQSILQAQFFKSVESYVVTADNISGTNAPYADLISPTNQFADCHANDIGLIFTRDAVDTSATDTHFFINLHSLMNSYEVQNSATISMNATPRAGANHIKDISASLNIKDDETSLGISNTVGHEGVYIKKATSSTVTDDLTNADESKLITEKALATILQNYVKYEISIEAGGDGMKEEGDI